MPNQRSNEKPHREDCSEAQSTVLDELWRVLETPIFLRHERKDSSDNGLDCLISSTSWRIWHRGCVQSVIRTLGLLRCGGKTQEAAPQFATDACDCLKLQAASANTDTSVSARYEKVALSL